MSKITAPKCLYEYDPNTRTTHCIKDGLEEWKTFDEKNRCVHWLDSSGYEAWAEFYENGSRKYYKNTNGDEFQYDNDGNLVYWEQNGVVFINYLTVV